MSNLFLSKMKIVEWVLRNPQMDNGSFIFYFQWLNKADEIILSGFAQTCDDAEQRADQQTLLSQIAKAVGATKVNCLILDKQEHDYHSKSEKILIMGEQLGKIILNQQGLVKPMHQLCQFKNSLAIISYAPAKLLEQGQLKAELWKDLNNLLFNE